MPRTDRNDNPAVQPEPGSAFGRSTQSTYYEKQARLRKAVTLATHLQSRGITSDHIENMHPSMRAHHAAMAGVNEASDETWSMVGSMLQGHEAETAKAKKPGYDPFAGL